MCWSTILRPTVELNTWTMGEWCIIESVCWIDSCRIIVLYNILCTTIIVCSCMTTIGCMWKTSKRYNWSIVIASIVWNIIWYLILCIVCNVKGQLLHCGCGIQRSYYYYNNYNDGCEMYRSNRCKIDKRNIKL